MAEDIDVEAMLEAPYKKDVSMNFNDEVFVRDFICVLWILYCLQRKCRAAGIDCLCVVTLCSRRHFRYIYYIVVSAVLHHSLILYFRLMRFISGLRRLHVYRTGTETLLSFKCFFFFKYFIIG